MPKINANKDYCHSALNSVVNNPFMQFAKWYSEVENALPMAMVNAMTLATVGTNGQPRARTVLLKEWDQEGFIFYTNYQSAKACEIAHQSRVALHFWWSDLERQIRIEGQASKVAPSLSETYFHSRPLGSQIAASLSCQSQVIDEIDSLRHQHQELLQRCQANGTTAVERPQHWGGYSVKPTLFEFWQGGASRLHDRFEYRLDDQGHWHIARLAP